MGFPCVLRMLVSAFIGLGVWASLGAACVRVLHLFGLSGGRGVRASGVRELWRVQV